MKYVEFMGLPGSGKSTIRDALVTQLKQKSGDSYSTSDEAFIKASRKYSDRHFRILLKLIPEKIAIKHCYKFMNRSQSQFHYQNLFLSQYGESFKIFISSESFKNLSEQEKINVIGSFLETGSLLKMIERSETRDKLIFFEEGIVQKSFMFLSSQNLSTYDFGQVSHYLDNTPLPDYLVYIKADLENCFNRMKKRPSGLTNRLKSQKEDKIMSFLHKANSHLENIANHLEKQHNKTTLIQIDNNQEIGNNIDKLEALFSPISTEKNSKS